MIPPLQVSQFYFLATIYYPIRFPNLPSSSKPDSPLILLQHIITIKMAFGGIALKSVSMFLRFIEFCSAAIILGIFTYFLVVLHNHDLHIDTYIRAVEGISGGGVLYTIIAILLVCFLAGKVFFSAVAMLLDLAFAGAFAYVAYATRHGDSCTGFVQTPLGNGNLGTTNSVLSGNGGFTVLPSLHTACRLNTACFAVSIVAAYVFLPSILLPTKLI